MVVAKLERQQVLGALKATGSQDPDILYAAKEALLSETRKHKLLGIAPIVAGVVMTLTILGAIVGIPMIIFGVLVRNELYRNIAVADGALAEYLGGDRQSMVTTA